MKTKLFKNSNESEKTSVIEMSKEEQKSIQGGLQYIRVRNPDGSVDFVILP